MRTKKLYGRRFNPRGNAMAKKQTPTIGISKFMGVMPSEFQVCMVKRRSVLISTDKETSLKECDEKFKSCPSIEPGSAVWVDHIDQGLICCHTFGNVAPGRMLIISEQFCHEVLAPTTDFINHPDRWKHYGKKGSRIMAHIYGYLYVIRNGYRRLRRNISLRW